MGRSDFHEIELVHVGIGPAAITDVSQDSVGHLVRRAVLLVKASDRRGQLLLDNLARFEDDAALATLNNCQSRNSTRYFYCFGGWH